MTKKAKVQRKSVSVTVQRTVQVTNYQPVTVSVTEVAEVEAGADHREVRDALHASASAGLQKYMRHEIEKYRAKDEDDD